MYEINRGERIRETLRIKGNDGTSADFTTDIAVDDMFREYAEIMGAIKNSETVLAQAQNAADGEAIKKVYDHLGGMVEALLRLVFGEEGGAKLLLLYNGKFLELLGDVFPFVEDVVGPKLVARMDAQAAKYTRER